MHWIDWVLFSIPIAIVVIAAIKAQRYVHGVADFLSAGRIANRYVLCVADGRVEGHVSIADAAEINGVEDSRN